MTSVARTPSTTSRPGRPSAAASAGGGGSAEHQRGSGDGGCGAALWVRGDDVDLVTDAEQLGHGRVGEPDRQRDQVGAVVDQ